MNGRLHRMWIACLAMSCAGVFADAAGAEEFTLEVPGSTQAASSAVLEKNTLRITGPGGKRFDYRRRPELDADYPAGRFLGYYCQAADQYVLWPAKGSGAMIIGTPAAGKIDWRKSRMEIRRKEAAPVAAPKPVGPMHLAVLQRFGSPSAVARIDTAGRLALYKSTRAGWHYSQAPLAVPLLVGAPLALAADPHGGVPLVYTFSPRGELVVISGGARVGALTSADAQPFRPGSNLAVFRVPGNPKTAAALDDRGRIWRLDLSHGRHAMIEPQPGRYVTGSPVAAAATYEPHVFAIDVRGALVHYSSPVLAESWSQPRVLGRGLVPGGAVAAHVYRPSKSEWVVLAASVDAAGVVRIFRHTEEGWARESIDGVRLPPGAPLTLVATGEEMAVTAVQANGTWVEWRRSDNRWTAHPIAAGFPVGAPVVAVGLDGALFGVDATGRIVVATLEEGRWRLEILVPPRGFVPRFPQLVSRVVQPKPPLPPAATTLVNSHNEELLVRIADARQPARPAEVSIKPGGSVGHRFDRDAGAELVEVYLVPGPDGGMVRQQRRWPVPPRQIYTVAVYAERVTSGYVDRRPPSAKPPGSLPDSETKTTVSLGVFPIPPGERLAPKGRLDVYREAKSRNNPGAAAWFGIPGGRR